MKSNGNGRCVNVNITKTVGFKISVELKIHHIITKDTESKWS